MSGVLIPFLMPVYPGAFPTFHATAADRARVAYMPGTTWPVGGLPPGSSCDLPVVAVSMPSVDFRHFNGDSLALAFPIPT